MSRTIRRIGIFGGSFDPPHIGHLIIAELSRLTLNLDLVVFVPAYRPPHKQGKHPATAGDRLAMTKLAVKGNRALRVSDIELKRKGVSYTVDTVKAFQRRYAKAEIYLIVGGDSLLQFHRWKNPGAIMAAASLAVFRRPGSIHPKSKVPPSKISWVKGPLMEVSSSDIREKIRDGKSIQYMVRDNVLAYITRRKLYRNSNN